VIFIVAKQKKRPHANTKKCREAVQESPENCQFVTKKQKRNG